MPSPPHIGIYFAETHLIVHVLMWGYRASVLNYTYSTMVTSIAHAKTTKSGQASLVTFMVSPI